MRVPRLGTVTILFLAACAGLDSAAPGNNGQIRLAFPASLFSFTGLVVESVHFQAFRRTGVEHTALRLLSAGSAFRVGRDGRQHCGQQFQLAARGRLGS